MEHWLIAESLKTTTPKDLVKNNAITSTPTNWIWKVWRGSTLSIQEKVEEVRKVLAVSETCLILGLMAWVSRIPASWRQPLSTISTCVTGEKQHEAVTLVKPTAICNGRLHIYPYMHPANHNSSPHWLLWSLRKTATDKGGIYTYQLGKLSSNGMTLGDWVHAKLPSFLRHTWVLDNGLITPFMYEIPWAHK